MSERTLKTQLEMARGALGKDIDQDSAVKWFKRVAKLAEGEQELRLIAEKAGTGRSVSVRDRQKEGVVLVVVYGKNRGDEKMEFVEPFEGFPSDTLKAQLVLLCG